MVEFTSLWKNNIVCTVLVTTIQLNLIEEIKELHPNFGNNFVSVLFKQVNG